MVVGNDALLDELLFLHVEIEPVGRAQAVKYLIRDQPSPRSKRSYVIAVANVYEKSCAGWPGVAHAVAFL